LEAGSMEQREDYCEFRIAKPGTRPKGGSPKDNFEFGKAWGRGKGVRCQVSEDKDD
jgi:hypothetical protein